MGEKMGRPEILATANARNKREKKNTRTENKKKDPTNFQQRCRWM